MDVIVRFIITLAVLFVLTRWLTRKFDPAFGDRPLIVALGLHVAMALLYGYIFWHFYGGDDTWMLNQESIEARDLIIHQPGIFWRELNPFWMVGEYGRARGLTLFRQQVEESLITLPLALFNGFSRGHYYTNVLAFVGMSFWGSFWFFQLLRRLWPSGTGWSFWVVFGYLPTVFWLSGLRKDPLIFMAFALCLWQAWKWWRLRRAAAGGWMLVALGFLFFLRPLMAVVLAPALVALAWLRWRVAGRQTIAAGRSPSPARVLLVVYGLSLLAFLATAALPGKANLLEAVVSRQQEYRALDGKTRIALDTLEATPASFLRGFPQALSNVWLHPSPSEVRGALPALMLAQNIFIICMVALALWRWKRLRAVLTAGPFPRIFCWFALFVCLSIGYTVPFPGAIIRYRVIPELCLLVLAGWAGMAGLSSHYNFFNVYKNDEEIA